MGGGPKVTAHDAGWPKALPPEAELAAAWGTECLLAAVPTLQPVLTIDDVLEQITDGRARHPHFVVTEDSMPMPTARYTTTRVVAGTFVPATTRVVVYRAVGIGMLSSVTTKCGWRARPSVICSSTSSIVSTGWSVGTAANRHSVPHAAASSASGGNAFGQPASCAVTFGPPPMSIVRGLRISAAWLRDDGDPHQFRRPARLSAVVGAGRAGGEGEAFQDRLVELAQPAAV